MGSMKVTEYHGIDGAPVGEFFVASGLLEVRPDVCKTNQTVSERTPYACFYNEAVEDGRLTWHRNSLCWYRFPDGLSKEEMEQQAQDLLRLLQLSFSQE